MGLISKNTKPEPDSTQSGGKGGGSALTPQALRAKMSLPPNLQEPYMRVVLAGTKIMYSQQMQPQIVKLLQGPGPVSMKLGQGVLALLAMIYDQSNKTMPPQLFVPCGIELVSVAAQFFRKAGIKVQDSDISDGISVLIQEIMQKAGIDPSQLPQLAKQAAGSLGGQPAQPAAQPAPQPAAPAAPAQGA
jgi:hypothetical protein